MVYLSIKFSDSACDISAVYKGAILYQSLVLSIETKKNNVNTIQILLLKNKNLLEVWIVLELFFLLPIASRHNHIFVTTSVTYPKSYYFMAMLVVYLSSKFSDRAPNMTLNQHINNQQFILNCLIHLCF